MLNRARTISLACAAAAALPATGCLSLPGRSARHSAPPTHDSKPTVLLPVEAELKLPVDPPVPDSGDTQAREHSVPDNAAAAIAAITRQTSSHARAIEAIVSQRAAEPSPPVAAGGLSTVLAPRASAVQWLDPNRYQLSLGPANPSGGEQAIATDATGAGPTTSPADGVALDVANLPLQLADPAEKPAVAFVTASKPGTEGTLSPPPTGTATSDGMLQSRLGKRIRENPRDVASHLEYQLMLFLLDEQVPNLGSISSLPQEDRELVTAVLDGLSNLRSTLRRDVNLMIGEKIKPIVELSDRLKTRAELTVPTLALARRVDGFGRYEQVDGKFIAGRKTQTIVYCEIENFSSQFNAEQLWETNLTMEVVLFSEMGQQVYNDPPATIADTSRSKRHDFFVRKLIELPANLVIGRYVLKVTIVDTQSNRVAEMSVPIQLVAG